MINVLFHQLPFTQDRTKIQKGMFSLDIAFTWFFLSSKAVIRNLKQIRNVYTTFNLNYSTGPSLSSCMSKPTLF